VVRATENVTFEAITAASRSVGYTDVRPHLFPDQVAHARGTSHPCPSSTAGRSESGCCRSWVSPPRCNGAALAVLRPERNRKTRSWRMTVPEACSGDLHWKDGHERRACAGTIVGTNDRQTERYRRFSSVIGSAAPPRSDRTRLVDPDPSARHGHRRWLDNENVVDHSQT